MKDFQFIYSEKQKEKQSKRQDAKSTKIARDPVTGLWKNVIPTESTKISPKELSKVKPKSSETVASLVAKTAVRLAQVGISTPRQDAEILLAFCFSTNLSGLYTLWREPIKEDLAEQYEAIVQRRLQREPVAYITGTVSFYGLNFMIDGRAMVPRPETELMVQKIIETAKTWAGVREFLVCADVGTGCGAIAIACAYHLNFLKIYGIDISDDILDLARLNAAQYHFENSIAFLKGNLLEALPEPVHVVIANLPYIAESEFEKLEPEIKNFEPKEAFLAGKDGLWHIRNLLTMAPEYLLRGGKIFLEIGDQQAQATQAIVNQYFTFARCEVLKDMAGKDRLLIVHTS